MEDEEYKKLPIEDRCVHKLWKARVNGYEEVTKLFRQIDDDKSPEFGKYLGLVKKFVIDSNAMGQEKGLEAALAYVENYKHAGKTVSEVMTGVVSKCIAAPKTRTKELALQITLMYVEIEKAEAVEEELIQGMDQKNPKIVSACIVACTTALREFGSKVFPVKPLVKKIQVLLSDRDKTVRDEAKIMVVEIYRWIGGALRSQLNNLQPVQITELETEFAKVEGQKAIPQRFIRSEQAKQATLPTVQSDDVDGGGTDEGEEDETPQIDPYDLADPVDIISKLPKDFFEKMEAKKWQERKEALDILEKLAQTPKLQNGDYADIVRILKKTIEKDSNVVVVALAGRCLAGLATGLKKRFQQFATACVSSLLEKFKEKKQAVVTAIKDAIDAIYLTTTLEAVSEDIIEALANKNPTVKTETALFLARAFTQTQPTSINKKLLKALTAPLLKNINESDPAVRDSAAEAIGTLMKLVGEKAISPFLVELEKDNFKMAKVKECCEKAVIIIKIAAGRKERPTTAPAKVAPVTKPIKSAPKSAPTKATAAKKKPEAINTATVVRSKKPKKAAVNKIVEKELGDEEVSELISAVISSTVTMEISSANWKARLAACEQFLRDVQTVDSKELPTQALVKCLQQKPGLKDTNFQVLKAKLDIIKYLAENSKFSITTADCCLLDIMDKFGDVKNGSLAAETITAVAEATSLSFVAPIAIDFAINQKNPKVLQETLLWLANAIREFGFDDLNPTLYIDNCKKALASTNPSVRQAAIGLCGVLYLYIGKVMYTFFENEKPALRDQINVEFDKYEKEKPPPPTRGLSKAESEGNLVDDHGEEAEVEAPPVRNIQDLLPRVDISNQITESLINELNDKNWKVRNEALTKVSTIIQEAKFIKSNLGDLPQALAQRLTDSNGKIAQTSLNICENISKAMGPPSKQYIKVFFPHFLTCLGDNKNWMRVSAREAIDTYMEQCGHKEFFENEMIADGLKAGSPILRTELWLWLSEILPKIPLKSIPKEEILITIPHLYTNLEDRKADIRKNAQEAVLGIMIHVGYEAMVSQCEKLKPGSRSAIMAILDKTRPDLPAQCLPKLPDKKEKTVKGTKAIVPPKASVKTKGAAIAATKAVTGKKKDEEVDNAALLVINNMKHQRTIDESKLKVLKWNFTTPREEFVELLKDQMAAANVNKTLIFNMFHADFRFHIRAIESLADDLGTNSQALMLNLDLILKWLTLRFFDTNPSVLIKGLEYLNSVFNVLIESEYRMLENEASSFLPYLVLKVGDPKDLVRNGVKSLFKQLCRIYSVSRLFTYIMEGTKSKNARQRAECLEALAVIINDYGIDICTPSPAACLKEVAKQISDRDNSVRNAALNCVVQVYNIVGDKVYKMIGRMTDKDQSILEERIKRSRATMTGKRPKPEQIYQPAYTKEEITQPEEIAFNKEPEEIEDDYEEQDVLPPMIQPTPIKQMPETKGPYSLDTDFIKELDRMRSEVPPLNINVFDLDFLETDINIPTLSAADIRSKIIPLSPPKPLDPNLTMTRLSLSGEKKPSRKQQNPLLISSIHQAGSTDPATAIQGFEFLQEFINSPKHPYLLDCENEFMMTMVTQYKHLRKQNPKNDDVILKIYRSMFTVLDMFYHNKDFGRTISLDVIKDILDQLIWVLVDGDLEHCPNGASYVKVTNLICAKVIEKSDHTRLICALLQLLQGCIRLDICPRHTELVMKCMWRVIKNLPIWSSQLDFDSMLLEVHNFLKEFPSSWWKNKSSDTPLRTVKTILHSSVKIKEAAILTHFSKIQNPSESEIEPYILKVFKNLNIKVVKPQLSRAAHTRLTDIFQKIGKEDETKEGLTLLYDFLEEHPEADIEPFLKKSSQFFQDYIRKGLKDIENARTLHKITTEKEDQVLHTLRETDHGPEYWERKLKVLTEIINRTDND